MKAFKCMRTGVYYPADYVEEWGRKYGHCCGSVPVSEAFINNYYQKPAGGAENPIYPMQRCFAQIQEVDITEQEYNAHKAILDSEDPTYSQRAAVMKERQIAHGRIPNPNAVPPVLVN